MRRPPNQSASCHLTVTILLVPLLLLTGCGVIFSWFDTNGDLAAFKQMTVASPCSDIRNRLFLIDDELVFWDQAGNCADASYAQTLFGSTPDEVLCTAHDSIAGPMQACSDPHYQELFETILANLEEPDLALGPDHSVQPVAF